MVDEDELEELREKRLEEIEDQESDSRERQQEKMKQMASQYLTKEARSRLGNIRAAKPELAGSIEMQIARLGQAGQVDKVTDEQLKDILRSLQNEKKSNESKIKFRR